MNTNDVENFPGFPDGIMGPDLMDNLRKQAERFGAELVADDAVSVDLRANPKVVSTATESFLAKAVIIATGSGYRKLGLPDEQRLALVAGSGCPATGSPGAPRVTGSSSATRTSSWSAVVTRRWRRPRSSPGSRTRST